MTTKLVEVVRVHEGRDKIYRTVQYTLRYVLSCTSSPGLAPLEHHISLARKLQRMLNDVQYLDKGVAALNNPDRIEGVGRAVAAFGKCVWLLTDHVEYLYRIKVLGGPGPSPAQRWAKLSNWLWLLGYIGSVLLYIRRLRIVNTELQAVKRRFATTAGSEAVTTAGSETDHACADENVKVMASLKEEITVIKLNIIREIIDCGIPASGVGLLGVGRGAQAGVLSSLVGLYQVYRTC